MQKDTLHGKGDLKRCGGVGSLRLMCVLERLQVCRGIKLSDTANFTMAKEVTWSAASWVFRRCTNRTA